MHRLHPQSPREFWAARQRIAAFNRTAGSETAPNNHAAECLLLRLDALEMQLRSRLEAQWYMNIDTKKTGAWHIYTVYIGFLNMPFGFELLCKSYSRAL